jgi:hypothetical protein
MGGCRGLHADERRRVCPLLFMRSMRTWLKPLVFVGSVLVGCSSKAPTLVAPAPASDEPRPGCTPQAAALADGYYPYSALPSGACEGAPSCQLGVRNTCPCPLDVGPLDDVWCDCVGGSWSCAVKFAGASACPALSHSRCVADAAADSAPDVDSPLPQCFPRDQSSPLPEGGFSPSALPQGSCEDVPTCSIPIREPCPCPPQFGALDTYECACASLAWSCTVTVRGRGACVCPSDAGPPVTTDADPSDGPGDSGGDVFSRAPAAP